MSVLVSLNFQKSELWTFPTKAEDIGAITECGQPAGIYSAPTPNATSLMKLWDQSISKSKKSYNIYNFRRGG